MELQKQFKMVAEVARCGSISKAAKTLGIAQPTLSKYISNLEEKLGTELFDRRKLPLSLTEAGERYVRAGNRIVDIYSQLERDLEKLGEGETQTVRVGISPTRAHYMLASIVDEFRKKNSCAKLVVRERTTSQLSADLVRGDIDLAISLKCDGMREFALRRLFSEKIMIAVPKEYQKSDAMQILKECPFITIGEGLRMSDVLLDILDEVGGKEPDLSVQSIESALSLANRGAGVALAPSYIAEYGRFDNLIFIELPDEVKRHFGASLEREVCVFYKKNRTLSKAEADFIKACEGIAKYNL